MISLDLDILFGYIFIFRTMLCTLFSSDISLSIERLRGLLSTVGQAIFSSLCVEIQRLIKKELNIWIQRHAVIRYILYKNKEETHKILKEPHAAEIITFVILQFNIYRGSLITGKFTSFAGQCYHNSMPRVFVKIIS